MRTIYTAHLQRFKDGHYSASFSPYDIIIDSDEASSAIKELRRCMIQEGINRKDFMPKETTDMGSGDPVYFDIDVEAEFRSGRTTAVRRNVTLPEWLDQELRAYDADGSKLFQNAAINYINEQKRWAAKIMTVEDLEAQVDKEILDAYIVKRLGLWRRKDNETQLY